MKEIILQNSNFQCRENIYICRSLRRLRRLAVEYVKNSKISDPLIWTCNRSNMKNNLPLFRFHSQGCVPQLHNWLMHNLAIVLGAGVSLAVIQV